MSKCKLCEKEMKRMSLTCSKGTICKECADDTHLAECQPIISSNHVLWVLAETFFRKGKGENTSFEKVWKEQKFYMKLVDFDKLLDVESIKKRQMK